MRVLLCLLALALLVRSAAAQEVVLTWDAVEDPRLSSYVVYQAVSVGSNTTAWHRAGEVKAPETTFTVTLPDDKNYVWYVTAKGKDGYESQASNAVNRFSSGPPGVPGNLTKSERDSTRPAQ